MTAGMLANKQNVTWRTKEGVQEANWYGSLTQASTVFMGTMEGRPIYVPLKSLVPMINPDNVVLGGSRKAAAGFAFCHLAESQISSAKIDHRFLFFGAPPSTWMPAQKCAPGEFAWVKVYEHASNLAA